MTQQTIDELARERDLPDALLSELIESAEYAEYLYRTADRVRREQYGDAVYIRGLIEFTNYCRNNCYYCGIRRDNTNISRYRLTEQDVLTCCAEGYALGFRTFVLQGGEDGGYSDVQLCKMVSAIKQAYPDCAVTLSVGERNRESYQAFFDAGATRYLLRHETADDAHYGRLHPAELRLENRKRCLFDLKEIGFQVGAGFMVGSPYQTTETLISDFRFLQELKPDMIGIGPFISQKDTPFAAFPNGSAERTLRLLSILRLMFPYALLPATTALGTIHPMGRELGLKAGANVVMPNLSPVSVRKNYALYDNKLTSGEESAQSLDRLKQQVAQAGYRIVTDIGNVKKESGEEHYVSCI